MSSNILLSDVDGVPIDWLQGYIDYQAEKGVQALHNKPKYFSMVDIFPTLEKPWLDVMDFQHTEHYLNLKAYKGAKEAYNKLYDNGTKIYFITSCGETDFIKSTREKMLNRELDGKFEDIIYCPLGGSKEAILKKFAPATFIDDQINMVNQGFNAGHNALLKNMTYNINDVTNGNSRLREFDEIYRYIKMEGISKGNNYQVEPELIF